MFEECNANVNVLANVCGFLKYRIESFQVEELTWRLLEKELGSFHHSTGLVTKFSKFDSGILGDANIKLIYIDHISFHNMPFYMNFI